MSAGYSGHTNHQSNHNVIKESKIDELSASLNGLRVSHSLACHYAELSIRNEMTANKIMGPTDLNEAVKMIKNEETEAFSSKIIHYQTKTINGIWENWSSQEVTPYQEDCGPTAEAIEAEHSSTRVSCQGTNKWVRHIPRLPLDPTGIPHHFKAHCTHNTQKSNCTTL